MEKLASVILVDDDETTNYLNQTLLEEASLGHLTLGDWTQSPGRVLVRCELNQQRVKQKKL